MVAVVLKNISQSHSVNCWSAVNGYLHCDYFMPKFLNILPRRSVLLLLIVVVLTETDRLTKEAQHALRRTMEKYTRLILCCNSTSKIIPAIQSRCLGIRVAAPSLEEVRLCLVPASSHLFGVLRHNQKLIHLHTAVKNRKFYIPCIVSQYVLHVTSGCNATKKVN